MKKYFKIAFLLSLVVVLFTACDDDNIDPITKVAPGEDASAPLVSIISPVPGFQIQVPDPVTSITIKLKAEDDIEITNVTVSFDGVEIATYTDFLDYRIVTKELKYDQVTTGDHEITVSATDIAGNTTMSSVTFSKKPPYTPLFEGETFYMPFDGSYANLITFDEANEVGNPGFSSETIAGSGAYDGAADSYLTYPSAGLAQGSEFSATFWLKIDASDGRSGIIAIAPPTPSAPSDKPSGFGLIREGNATAQKFILLVGNGTNATWVNPGAPATIDPSLNEWVHFGITISETKASLYMNGALAGESDLSGFNWDGVGDLSIMSGDPNFNGWNHKVEKGQMDELRLYNKALSLTDIQTVMLKEQAALYMSFNGDYKDAVSKEEATPVGNPDFNFTDAISEYSYQGAPDSYLTFPSDDLAEGTSFTTAFWLKIDETNGRSGIINIAPAEPAGPADKPSGFGLIREGNETAQKFILLVGNGTNATWVNPGAPATIDPSLDEWVHIAITISNTSAILYLDGEVAGQSDLSGFNWANVGDLSIMSGDPNFNGWNHKTETGLMDELFIFKQVLTKEQIQLLMN